MMTELEGIGWVTVGFTTTLVTLDIGWRLAKRKKVLEQEEKKVATAP